MSLPEFEYGGSLDRPVWASLTTSHSHLSFGSPLARRYAREVNLFASARDDTEPALAALAVLVEPGERVYALQVPKIAVPPGLIALQEAMGVQMVATRSFEVPAGREDILKLADADAPEMLALAKLTEPGPFLARTHHMGRFMGIRIDGRLAAMAGERFRFPGYTEVSGVCTHPDHRGKGYANVLVAALTKQIVERGDTAFLHVKDGNSGAARVYEKLGFSVRAVRDIAALKKVEEIQA